mmetsp:Transcript_34180/g.43128  ORF Transcript_34180/g.43128 Transcript_34180/m.43128 type:complete len:545 (-) Transcript_34180:350-1984(-)
MEIKIHFQVFFILHLLIFASGRYLRLSVTQQPQKAKVKSEANGFSTDKRAYPLNFKQLIGARTVVQQVHSTAPAATKALAVAARETNWLSAAAQQWSQICQHSEQVLPILLSACAGVAATTSGIRSLAASWKLQGATQKFLANWPQYLTIPLLGGAVGWVTNKVGVEMLFYPINYVGVGRVEGQPFGWGGLQGIVPAKVRQMGTDMMDMAINELLDINALFNRIDGQKLADLMAERGALANALANAASSTGTLPGILCSELRAKASKDATATNEDDITPTLVAAVTEKKAKNVVKRVVHAIQKDQAGPLNYIDLQSSVVDDLSKNREKICELFKICGKDELRFIVDMGLWGGMALGVAQMALWVVWSPRWSLAAGGALVGYITDWTALKILFEPVQPTKIGGFQGLFLQRQNEVSEAFGTFMEKEILTGPALWKACLSDPRFMDLLAEAIHAECGPLVKNGRAGSLELARALGPELQKQATVNTHDYLCSQLNLGDELSVGMKGLSSARFESVLHPIFQEDENTLIAIGALLGAAAGLIQTVFY